MDKDSDFEDINLNQSTETEDFASKNQLFEAVKNAELESVKRLLENFGKIIPQIHTHTNFNLWKQE